MLQPAHAGKFLSKWKTNRPWLEHDAKANLLTCADCKLAKFASNFTSGCPSVRVDVIKQHEETDLHVKAVAAADALRKQAEAAKASSAAADTAKAKATIDGLFNSLNQEAIEIMTKRLKIVYHLCKQGRPLSDFQAQMELQEELKTPLINLNAAFPGNVTYDSSVFVNEATSAIAEWVWQQTLAKLTSSTFLGVMIDESTDTANLSELIVYLTGVTAGKPFVAFGDLLPIKDQTALTVAKRLLKWLHESGADINNLTFLSTDGASNMRGQHEGHLF